jgi:hypothetical protein
MYDLFHAGRVRSSAIVGVLLFLLFASVTGFLLRDLRRPGFTGDGVGYYAPLASLLVDGDLELQNELAHLNPSYLRAAFMTPEGALGNPFPIGPAILWAPGILVVRNLPSSDRLDAPLPSPTQTQHPAFAPRFARAVLWMDMLLFLVAGAVLTAALAVRVGPVVAPCAVLLAAVGTPLFFYVLHDPSYGHTSSFFACALLVAAALRERQRPLPLELLGFLWGFAALVRSQDAVLGVLLLPRLLDEWRQRRDDGVRAWIFTALRFALPALLAFLPQMLFWYRIYGTPLLVPPGPDFLPLWRPQLLHFLFSTWNGAFVWSPLLLVGIAGLVTIEERGLRYAFLAAIVLEIYSCSVLMDWWGGRAFGARRLVSIVPIASTGLAFLAHRLRIAWFKWVPALAAAILLCLCSVRLAEYHRHRLLPQNPGNAADYVRHHVPGTKPTFRYGLWDYPRLLSEIAESERLLRASRRSQRPR